jgi:hypothetical protein
VIVLAAALSRSMFPPKGRRSATLAGRPASRNAAICQPTTLGRSPYTAATNRFPIRLVQGRMRMGRADEDAGGPVGCRFCAPATWMLTYNYAVRVVQLSVGRISGGASGVGHHGWGAHAGLALEPVDCGAESPHRLRPAAVAGRAAGTRCHEQMKRQHQWPLKVQQPPGPDALGLP